MAKKELITKYEISEPQEEYLRIYHEYFVLKWTWNDICKHHNCARCKIKRAIDWVIENKLKFPAKYLIKGAIDTINDRMKKNKELYDFEANKKRYRDNQFVVSLARELREDEKELLKLQEIYHADDEDTERLSAGQVLKLISEAQRETGKQKMREDTADAQS